MSQGANPFIDDMAEVQNDDDEEELDEEDDGKARIVQNETY
jgi:hypothetical protein